MFSAARVVWVLLRKLHPLLSGCTCGCVAADPQSCDGRTRLQPLPRLAHCLARAHPCLLPLQAVGIYCSADHIGGSDINVCRTLGACLCVSACGVGALKLGGVPPCRHKASGGLTSATALCACDGARIATPQHASAPTTAAGCGCHPTAGDYDLGMPLKGRDAEGRQLGPLISGALLEPVLGGVWG